jgi:hypothetical protein
MERTPIRFIGVRNRCPAPLWRHLVMASSSPMSSDMPSARLISATNTAHCRRMLSVSPWLLIRISGPNPPQSAHVPAHQRTRARARSTHSYQRAFECIVPARKEERAFANDAFANELHAHKGLAGKRRAGRSDTDKSFANRRVVVENVEHYYCILRTRKTASEQERARKASEGRNEKSIKAEKEQTPSASEEGAFSERAKAGSVW